jgi:hypothetical protein
VLSVIIPTEGLEHPAVATLAALVPGAAAGVVREVLLVDRARSGVIERVADVAGCRFVPFEGSHAAALAAGARQARSPGRGPGSSATPARPMPARGCATVSSLSRG